MTASDSNAGEQDRIASRTLKTPSSGAAISYRPNERIAPESTVRIEASPIEASPAAARELSGPERSASGALRESN